MNRQIIKPNQSKLKLAKPVVYEILGQVERAHYRTLAQHLFQRRLDRILPALTLASRVG